VANEIVVGYMIMADKSVKSIRWNVETSLLIKSVSAAYELTGCEQRGWHFNYKQNLYSALTSNFTHTNLLPHALTCKVNG